MSPAVVKQTPGAIGYVELAYAKQTGLAWAQMKNKAGNYIRRASKVDHGCCDRRDASGRHEGRC